MNKHETVLSFTDSQLKAAFGKSLKELREHTAITQKDLSKACNIPRQSLSVYERGEIAPTIMQAYRIVSHFSLTIEDFIAYGLEEQRTVLEENFSCICDKYDAICKT